MSMADEGVGSILEDGGETEYVSPVITFEVDVLRAFFWADPLRIESWT
jgi:hypothetical protein